MKVKGPLLSKEARGTAADVLTFSIKQTGQQVRYQKKQKDKNSALQQSQRADFLNASFACRFMDYGESFFGASIYGHEKTPYNELAKNKGYTGYNLCIKEIIEVI